jgi:uncharacterized membrane protein
MAIDEVTAPSRVDPFVRDATTIVGGPVGRHARLGGAYFWTPLRVLVALTCLTFLAGFGLKTPCSTHPWGDHYQYTRLCYSDVFALYFSEGINEHQTPYVDHAVEYPVVIGGAMWLAGEVSDDARDFFNVTSAGMLVCAVATVLLLAGTAGRRRPWDAALFALAPGLLLHGTTNWDLVAVALAAAGLWAWSRRQPALAGLWIGLGVATKLYPALFLVGLFFLCWRAARLREWVQCAFAAVVTVVLVYLPVVLTSRLCSFDTGECTGQGRRAWLRFFVLNRTRPADWDSLAFAWQWATGKTIQLTTLNLVTAVAVLAVVAAVGLIVMTAPRRPRVAQVLFLLLAGFLLVNKVNSPQYTLWLIPLAALARPRWGAFLAWQASEALVMFTRFYFFVWEGTGHADGIDTRWFVGAVLLRDALLAVLMGLVIREIFAPYHDVVRRDGEDDPAGGVLDGTLDRAERADDEWLPAARPAAAAG